MNERIFVPEVRHYHSAMENLADGEDRALVSGCLVWLQKEKDIVMAMTGEVNEVFGDSESNADNVAREDEITNAKDHRSSFFCRSRFY